MARGITEHDVHTAADSLVAAGERPTVERIRAHLGTGSPNTLIRLLDHWWSDVGQRLTAQNRKLALPDAPDAVVEVASTLWLCALEHAQKQSAAQMRQEQEQLAADRAALEQSRAKAAVDVTTANEATAIALQAQRTTELHAADVQRLAEHQADQIQDVIRQRTALQAQTDELICRLAAIDDVLAQQRLQAEEERQSRDAHLRTTEERWLREVDRARQEAASMQKQCERLERERAEAAKAAKQRIETLETALRLADRAQVSSSAEVTALNAEVTRLHEQWRAHRNVPKMARPSPTSSKPKASSASPKKR